MSQSASVTHVPWGELNWTGGYIRVSERKRIGKNILDTAGAGIWEEASLAEGNVFSSISQRHKVEEVRKVPRAEEPHRKAGDPEDSVSNSEQRSCFMTSSPNSLCGSGSVLKWT